MGKQSKKPSKPGAFSAVKKKAKPAAASSAAPKYTVEDLLAKIEELIEQFEFETAWKFCERALEVDPNHSQVLEAAGTILLELNNPEQAFEILSRAVSISPDVGHVKYMYLAQMCEGAQAAGHYVKGLSIMEKTLALQSSHAAAASANPVKPEEVCTGYCSLAELYLTDLCFEDDAQVRCGEYGSKALQFCPDNPEALQLMASFRLSEGKAEEAEQLIVKSVDSWLPSISENEEAPAGVAASAGEQDERIVPPYPARVAAAKILIEVGQHQRAFSVLDGLIDDDDEVIQVWYLFGWAHHSCNEPSDSRAYLLKAQELSAKHECDDADMLAHISELLAELGPETDDEDAEDADDVETAAAEDEEEEMEG